MSRKEREKGKRGERELAKELSRLFHAKCRRRQQYSGTEGTDDIAGLPGVHVECKRTETLRLWDAIEQAKSDCGDNLPMVCHRPNGREWLAIVPLESLPALVNQLHLILYSEQSNG